MVHAVFPLAVKEIEKKLSSSIPCYVSEDSVLLFVEVGEDKVPVVARPCSKGCVVRVDPIYRGRKDRAKAALRKVLEVIGVKALWHNL